jgi:hypothetical protein
MTSEAANFLVNVADSYGIEARLRDDYSGRGMYGSSTHGIVTDEPIHLLSCAIDYAASEAAYDENTDNIPNFSEERFSTDNMGYDTIIY